MECWQFTGYFKIGFCCFGFFVFWGFFCNDCSTRYFSVRNLYRSAGVYILPCTFDYFDEYLKNWAFFSDTKYIFEKIYTWIASLILVIACHRFQKRRKKCYYSIICSKNCSETILNIITKYTAVRKMYWKFHHVLNTDHNTSTEFAWWPSKWPLASF